MCRKDSVMGSTTQKPEYDVIRREGDIELRLYAPMIVAEVTVSGDRRDAVNTGFKLLADYIFGNNITNQKISMTAPVTQKDHGPSPIQIDDTFSIRAAGEKIWTVQFMMPRGYTLMTLPTPNSAAVRLREMPARTRAVITFSGRPSDKHIEEEKDKLTHYLDTRNLSSAGEPVIAYYDPPWVPWFLRQNEIQIDVDDRDFSVPLQADNNTGNLN